MANLARFRVWLGAVAVLGLLTSGCGKDSSGPRIPGGERDESVMAGGVEEAVNKVFAIKGGYLEGCDTNKRALEIEIAQALDDQRTEIENFAAAHPDASGKYKRVQLGPIFVRELVAPQATPSTQWEESPYSWDTINADYQKVKAKLVDSNWVRLNQDVRFILVNDLARVDGENFALTKDSAPVVDAAKAALEKCIADTMCGAPVFDPILNVAVQGIPRYKEWISFIGSFQDLATKRLKMAGFLKRLTTDQARYAMRKAPSVSRVSANLLKLRIDATPFAAVFDQFRGYIESVWSSAGLSLSLESGEAEKEPDLFKIIIGNGLGGRSFVTWSNKTVTLFSDVRARSIPHEIGHVLGFKDHYYTIWDSAGCQYSDQSLPSDLMSESTGGVTAEEWDILNKTYPL